MPTVQEKEGIRLKIGIYGGTFNPIHQGHMAAARAAVQQLDLDRLYLIPAGLPPHKAPPNGASGLQRLDMARLAAEALALDGRVEASYIELNREGKSYTLDTLRLIRRQDPQARLYLLMGTDMFLSFQDWLHPEEIAGLCTLCAFCRSETDRPEVMEDQRAYLARHLGAETVLLRLPRVVDISSTRLRELLSRGEGKAYLDPAVYGYILCQGLYGVPADCRALPLDDLRCAALSMLDHRRIPHVLGTEETAARLARRWGADEEEARRGALLHDCTKKWGREQQLALCRQYGIKPDEDELRQTKLLHALTGAAVAADRFGVSAGVAQAIRWHTTGKADMNTLEKILYLADYIEPTRDFCDLTELRRLAFADLDGAMLLGLTMAVEDLGKKGMPVHPNSVYARDYLKGTETHEQTEGKA